MFQNLPRYIWGVLKYNESVVIPSTPQKLFLYFYTTKRTISHFIQRTYIFVAQVIGFTRTCDQTCDDRSDITQVIFNFELKCS